jgi:signal transduction histidine kinase
MDNDTVATRVADTLAAAQADVAQDKALAPFLDEFTASIAHELNQSLATIVTKGETCLRWLGNEKPQIDLARAGVTTMIENALRLGDIVRRVSALSTEIVPRA